MKNHLKHLLLLFLPLTCFFFSCKKDKISTPSEYSKWYIDGDSIPVETQTKNIELDSTLTLTYANSLATNLIIFFRGKKNLPRSGTFKVVSSYPNEDECNVRVYKDGVYHFAKEGVETTLEVTTLANGKGQYKFEPTKFYYFFSPDTIIVNGTLIEP